MIVKTYPGCIPFSQSYRCNVDEIDIASKLLNDSIVYSVRIPHIISKVIQMVQEEKQPESFYEFNFSNVSIEEKLSFKSIFNEDIYDNLDIAFKDSQYRFIYLPEKNMSSIMVKWSAFSAVHKANFNFFTLFLGNKIKEDINIIKLCLDIIRADLNNYLVSNGVPINRITNFGPDIIAMDPYLITVSDAKFILNYFLYLFKKLDDCLDIKFNDFDKVYIALTEDIRNTEFGIIRDKDIIEPILNYDKSNSKEYYVIKEIYNTAITGNKSPNTIAIDPIDYSKLLEKVYYELIAIGDDNYNIRYAKINKLELDS